MFKIVKSLESPAINIYFFCRKLQFELDSALLISTHAQTMMENAVCSQNIIFSVRESQTSRGFPLCNYMNEDKSNLPHVV